MEKTTATATAKSKKRLPLIENYRDEVKDSASVDLEWIPYRGIYQHNKTKIFAACFCTNYGDRIVLHISRYSDNDNANPEKALIEDILFYLNQFPLTFGWYTTGRAVYDNKGHRAKGRDSDFFVLHQRCKLHFIKSPFEVRDGYVRLLDTGSIKNKKIHIDLIKIFEKQIIQNGVFQSKYRTTSLDTVSVSLLGVGKYNSMSAGTADITKLPIQEQERYVRRDAELTMLLAQYNNCLALRIMKVFSKYAEMDYYKVCYTNVSSWYANRYDKMIESGEVTIQNTPDYILPKERIGGGHHTTPISGFLLADKVYELDIKGQYPNIVMINNFSFDTLNCRCCVYNPKAQLNPETINIINQYLQENKIPRKVSKYWVCKKRKGAFPKLLEQVLSDRDKYLVLLKGELDKEEPNRMLIEEYQTHQLGAKLFANAGFGLFGNKYFKYTNYKVAECITGEGRCVHKQMEQKGQYAPYNFTVIFGFTDSTFFKDATDNKVKEFITDCKNNLGFIVELKNVFVNSIFYAKKNRYIAWTGLEKDEPVIKGLDGLSDSNPLWVQYWFKKILIEIIKHPENRFESIPRMLEQAFSDLYNGRLSNPELELRFSQRLKYYPHEYKPHVRTGILARELDKDKGDLVYWYETLLETSKKRSYSIKPENLNLQEYKRLLLKKLSDTLEITGFNLAEINSQFLQKQRLLTETQVVIIDHNSGDDDRDTTDIGSNFSLDQSNNRSVPKGHPKRRRLKLVNFNLMDLIKCKYDTIDRYFIVPDNPAIGVPYVSKNNLQFISGHLRVRGKVNGSYPYKYLEMIDAIFGREENTIEVCSYSVKGTDKDHGCFTVDINPATNPNLVEDGQTLHSIPNNRFNRWRCDPPYNVQTAKKMYGTDLPSTKKLLKAGARICKVGSLMFLLLGPQNYQWVPEGVKRIGWISLTVVPNNEVRCLHIYYKYADALD